MREFPSPDLIHTVYGIEQFCARPCCMMQMGVRSPPPLTDIRSTWPGTATPFRAFFCLPGVGGADRRTLQMMFSLMVLVGLTRHVRKRTDRFPPAINDCVVMHGGLIRA
jgi:hypothetical protein